MKKVIVAITAAIVILIFILITMWICFDNVYTMELEEQQETWEEINDRILPMSWYQDDGFDNISDWWTEISELKANNVNLVSETVLALGDYLNDEQVSQLTEIETSIKESHSVHDINRLLERATDIIASAEENKNYTESLKAQSVTNESSGASAISYNKNNYSSGDSSSFKSQGVVYMNGIRYTWYSQRVLPGGGLKIPGRHVDNGFVKDGDGNIVVASDFDARGSIVETPYGQGKVYDSGAGANTRDLYTDY